MRKLLLLIFGVFVLVACSKSGKNQPQISYNNLRFASNSLRQLDLKGNVNRVVTRAGGFIRSEFNTNGMITSISDPAQIFTYDEQGRLSRWSNPNSVVDFGYGTHDKYIYASMLDYNLFSGFLKGITSIDIKSSGNVTKYNYVINGESGTLTEINTVSGGSTTRTAQLVFSGQLPVSTTYNAFEYQKFTFSPNTGNIIRVITSNNLSTLSLSYKDNAFNSLIDIVHTFNSGFTTQTTLNSYDDNGELNKQSYTESIESETGVSSAVVLSNLTYEYDNKGNWLVKKNNSTSGKVETKRSIEYF